MNRLAPWFGADLAVAEAAAREIGQRAWVGIPFCGGASIIPFIQTRSGLAADLHRHIINLAHVIRDPATWEDLEDRLHGTLFHPDELLAAQRRCLEREARTTGSLFEQAWMPEKLTDADRVAWAADYFIAAWMGRGGHAGKGSEFTQGLAVRFTSSGGDSARRFRSAIESIEAWSMALRDWQFECIDCWQFLDRVKDDTKHALYIDAPWPDLGDDYKHRFDLDMQTKLRDRMEAFEHIRIVVRFGDHPLIRDLYGGQQWAWKTNQSRNQKNNIIGEALIVKGGE
ncbi:MAG: hypothetical protein IPK83_18640 [Planctomycetes bacterium]|nr:hypothetical protein [Planctomycetota bacterium]